ncbi:hypothetical protein [Natronomonas sp. EA1]|uniref:hypothetical protein n=1 Tax=Natronomonas sp. EA1 TaxID=3421655 RepID=UPI003EBD62D6
MNPIDGPPFLLAAAKASVGPDRLSPLLDRAQTYLAAHYETYDRRYETVHETDDAHLFFVESGHWAGLADELEMTDREADAVRRAHEEFLLHLGGKTGRKSEFETALELREAAVIGR